MEISKDLKTWYAIACPTTGVRFDLRTLELMDADHDGRVRTPEVIAALEYLKGKGVTLDALEHPSEEDAQKLEDVLRRQAELDQAEPSDAEKAAMAEWEAAGKAPDVAFLGEATAAAEAALAAVEPAIDGFFTPPEDMPLVTEEPDVELPLRAHLNPKYLEAVLEFAEKCVKPIIGDGKETLTRMEWKAIKAKFAPYRAWTQAKPVMSPGSKDELVDEERLLRYKLHLGELLENYVSMKRLYDEDSYAIFQTGILRIDGREMNLCFHVDSEAAHSALVGKSNCCVIYLKLTRPAEKAERLICAVVTAGRVWTLYVGRNGVFYDRDGKDWEAVITKVVESQVSLVEAFWAPWKKIGESIAGLVKKFIGDKQTKAMTDVQKGAESTQAGGAAMASSVAAIGIGVGMMGAAAASLITAIKGLHPWWMFFVALAAVVLVVSLPSMILAYFKLRRRDLGAILNASGWAVNREMRFSMKRALGFTKCPPCPCGAWAKWAVTAIGLVVIIAWAICSCCCCREKSACEQRTCEKAKACETVKACEKAAPSADAGNTIQEKKEAK